MAQTRSRLHHTSPLTAPYPTGVPAQWHTQDRLVGMKLLRYFNFCGRGYVPASQDMREWIVDKFKELFRDQFDAAAEVTRVFLNRKVRASGRSGTCHARAQCHASRLRV